MPHSPTFLKVAALLLLPFSTDVLAAFDYTVYHGEFNSLPNDEVANLTQFLKQLNADDGLFTIPGC